MISMSQMKSRFLFDFKCYFNFGLLSSIHPLPKKTKEVSLCFYKCSSHLHLFINTIFFSKILFHQYHTHMQTLDLYASVINTRLSTRDLFYFLKQNTIYYLRSLSNEKLIFWRFCIRVWPITIIWEWNNLDISPK